MPKRIQRGSVRVESGSWFGYWNTYYHEDTPDRLDTIKKRKQKCVKLGPAGRSGISESQAKDLLREKIKESEQQGGTAEKPKANSSIALKEFAQKNWIHNAASEWRVHEDSKNCTQCYGESNLPCVKHCPSRKSAEYVLSLIFAGKGNGSPKTFGETSLEDFTRNDLQLWLNNLAVKRGESTVKHAKHFLVSMFRLAVNDRYIPWSVASELKVPKNTKGPNKSTLTIEQFKAVLEELESPYDLLVKVGIGCALRPSELLALRWRDLDVKAKTFTIHETVYRGILRPYTKTTDKGETDKTLLNEFPACACVTIGQPV